MTRRPTISKECALIGVVALLLVAAALTGGWIWWTRPTERWAPIPDGLEKDEHMAVGSSLPREFTTAGTIAPAGIRSESHEWIAGLRWTDLERTEHIYELHLGESIEVAGLGRMTLVGVKPAPLIDPNKFSWLPGIEGKDGGGSAIYFVLEFEDGVKACHPQDGDCPRF
ncbi:Hypothetical protein ACGLYG10_1210 [Actinomyces glycerinitolerans]|uniref:Uncharacterized protein n=1 Tax=Actinomyces glycerinitolerans TaxID=1892869 RepID=A0A1M4RYG7_9ACTO|nr:Hypothetical protein ACGLYG10_1210 [Actinomyces glycerinitolerans]